MGENVLVKDDGSITFVLKLPRFLKTVKKEYLILMGILLLAFFLRILYFNKPNIDEIRYVITAKNILAGTYDPTTIFHGPALRYVFMGIVTFFVKFFGPSHYSLVLIPLFSVFGTIVSVYFIGKRCVNTKVGLLAAFLLAIFPLNIINSTLLEADVVISFLMCICFLLYLFVLLKQNSIV